MITPKEIKQQAIKWWKPFLQSHITGRPFFPKTIDRIGKIKPLQVIHRFESLQNELEELYEQSKNNKGIGYTIKTQDRNFRRTGTHELPDAIAFETAEDFIHFIEKKKEWGLFRQHCRLLTENIPQLESWIENNPEQLTTANYGWDNILKVCRYFLQHPRPGLYIRQLPVDVHTKFIEENNTLLCSLLDHLIPEHIRDVKERFFARRYYLNYDEPLIRLRILDARYGINHITDLSVRLSAFQNLHIGCRIIIITENKMNFLTLPSLPSACAIWSGGGFHISYIKNTEWMKTCTIFYWGDLDIQGFFILHQMRSYYPQTKSVLMDRDTFDRFQSGAVAGEPGTVEKLALLTAEEKEMHDYLKAVNLRLEQEKIPQVYVDDVLTREAGTGADNIGNPLIR